MVGRILGQKPAVFSSLADPRPFGRVNDLGDSTVKLTFYSWVNQDQHDYSLVRSRALIAIKKVFEEHEVDMPEPTYNLRMLNQSTAQSEQPLSTKIRPKPVSTIDLEQDGGDSGMDFARKEAAKEASSGDNSLEEKAPELLD